MFYSGSSCYGSFQRYYQIWPKFRQDCTRLSHGCEDVIPGEDSNFNERSTFGVHEIPEPPWLQIHAVRHYLQIKNTGPLLGHLLKGDSCDSKLLFLAGIYPEKSERPFEETPHSEKSVDDGAHETKPSAHTMTPLRDSCFSQIDRRRSSVVVLCKVDS